MGWPELLHETLSRRATPETVAQIITADPAAEARYDPDELVLLRRVARARPAWHVSSMPEDFERPADCADQVAAAWRIWGDGLDPTGIDPADPASVARWIDALGSIIGWRHGMDWKRDRLTARERRAAGWFPEAWTGHRAYNRRVRVLRHLEDKRARMEAGLAFRRLVLISHSGFACDIPPDRFAADPDAAAFIAYWVARKNRRREFTLDSRENPMDHLAAMLLSRCAENQATDWAMVAQVYSGPQVLAELADGDRGELAGKWWAVMAETARILGGAWAQLNGASYAAGRGPLDAASMIVRAGMDSSTWNITAGAYNAARAGWLNATCSAGASALTAPFLPGKVMRLMAADLAWWHRAAGGDVDPQTLVWARLPKPWDVITGREACTRADVEAACAQAGVDPVAAGWTGPHAAGDVAEFTPTPELVHGVTVADPAWAGLLRSAGVFAGNKCADAIRAGQLARAARDAGMVSAPAWTPTIA